MSNFKRIIRKIKRLKRSQLRKQNGKYIFYLPVKKVKELADKFGVDYE